MVVFKNRGITAMMQAMDIVGLSLATTCAWFDVRTKNIPNLLTIGGILLGFLLSFWMDLFFQSLLGLMTACLLLFPYQRGWLGGGDVRLMMAFGVLWGPWMLLGLWFWAAVYSIPLAVFWAWRDHLSIRQVALPYSLPLAFAVVSLLWMGDNDATFL